MHFALLIGDTWGMHDGGDVGWGWMVAMMLGMVVFWALVILGIVWLVRNVDRSGSTAGEPAVRRERPVEILERRFAEGAITFEDYAERRRVLVGAGAEPDDGSP